MYLIIKNKYLKKIKNFISTFCDFSKKKQEGVFIKCQKDCLLIYLNSDSFSTKIYLKTGDNLNIKNTGEVTINLKFLNQLLDTIEKNNDLEIFKAEENLLQFFSGKFKCDLRLFENAEIKEEKFLTEEKDKNTIDYQVLKNFFVRLKDFCKNPESNISTNTVLTNIHISNCSLNKEIEGWSSDSYRVVYGKMPSNSPKNFEINISPQIIQVILGIFSDYNSEDLDIWIHQDILTIKKNEYFFKTKLNIRKYPDFMHWFNENEKFKFSVDKEELIWAIDRNLLLSDGNIKTTSYRIENKKLFIEYKDNEKGFCEEAISIECDSEDCCEFSLNSFLLKSLLKLISSKKIIFKVSSPLKPIVILSDEENDQFKQFILPLSNA